ncbi:Hypothetical_protein [Hexamita inflata]|uniref:Hypothetical_protein n=1 Tax=Hexamita inflata TaxID=28002 RepID=A0AA86U852_9EUKA|nr:Hypothetical protein HINF_LOCUS32609 [Hexamita inflata]
MSLDKFVDQIEQQYLKQLPNMIVTDEQIEEIEIEVGFKYETKENKTSISNTEINRKPIIQENINRQNIDEQKNETVTKEYNSVLDDFNYKPITSNNQVITVDIVDEFGYKKEKVDKIEQNDDFSFQKPFVAIQQETKQDGIQIQQKQQNSNQILDDFGYQIADVEDEFSYKPQSAKPDLQVANNNVKDVSDDYYKPLYAKLDNQNIDISPEVNENDDFSYKPLQSKKDNQIDSQKDDTDQNDFAYKPLNARKTNQLETDENHNMQSNQLNIDSPENDFEPKNEVLEQFSFKPFVKKEQTFKPVIQNDSLEDFTPFKATQIISVPVKKNAVKAAKAKGGFVCCARPDYD